MPKGFFGDEEYNPTAYGPSSAYDVSGLAAGAQQLQDAPKRQKVNYDPMQFQTPDLSMGSDAEWNNAFNLAQDYALGSGARKIRANANAGMRGLQQGFGAGRDMNSPAMRELLLKQNQATGAQLADMTSDVGGRLASDQASNKLKAGQAVRDALFQANVNRQKDQSNENYRAAGFNASESQALTDDALRRVGMFMQYGMSIPQLMAQLNQGERQAYAQDYQTSMTPQPGYQAITAGQSTFG